ncbi:MAG TPA: hypothetical protein VEH80_09215 [Candidatus Bathyarchaeia archaeon]|nr:hypothetical protein [Candidatus Bathyarchaeia archaeon]
MDFGVYVTEKMAACRLADLRAESRQMLLLQSARPYRRTVRYELGAALIRVGRWLAAEGRARPNAGVRVAR